MQFDVYQNPVVGDRKVRPYVAILQADFAQLGDEKLAVPLVRKRDQQTHFGHLSPLVTIRDEEYVVQMQGLAGLRARSLGNAIGSIAGDRDRILAALDLLLFGL